MIRVPSKTFISLNPFYLSGTWVTGLTLSRLEEYMSLFFNEVVTSTWFVFKVPQYSIYAIMGISLVFVVACVLFICVITVLLSTCISYMSCSFLTGNNTKTATILGHMVKMHLFGIGDYKTYKF